MTSDRTKAEAAAKHALHHPNFKELEASRPPWDSVPAPIRYTQTPDPNWSFGGGANHTQHEASATAATARHVSIDPFTKGRTLIDNYKLLVSGIVPRPIAFISTRSRDGKSENLAPMSFFQLVNVDPPILAVSITSPLADAKDTLLNLLETHECVISIISEGFVEAANATCINTPYGASEWIISGLTPVYDCQTVKCARVKESVFSIEAKLESVREFSSRLNPGAKSGSLVLLEASHFWAREDALNEEENMLDLANDLRGEDGYQELKMKHK
ncbi:hypothetical protein CDV36_014718 [Fusarium kuroshium]|uniref:Flavin reductase like domain-containing protein n=1 Tax=Fusarium kuroshium TaxID=2010991 RepID=A0A3M2REM0_9HYPO|nr:hypothetical protein CDV36_014718 [Fusarium kuroshium]